MITCATILPLVLAACGNKESHPIAANATNDGSYVFAGPITYQLEVSRELNPSNIEDRGYLAGVTGTPPTPQEEWYAVFLWAKNQTHSPQMTTDSFDIVDTQGAHYYPVPINPQVNPYAWTAQRLAPSETEPLPGSTAFYGPTQGGELLFKINISAYANRPLTLEIHAPGQAEASTIALDL